LSPRQFEQDGRQLQELTAATRLTPAPIAG
jgi:hypothetical protein